MRGGCALPTNSEINGIIDEQIHSQRDRGILRRAKVDGICYEQIAEEYSVSRTTVYNIIRKHRGLFPA